MEGFRPPRSLEIHSGNLADNWRKFKQSYKIFMKASGKDEVTGEVKEAIFLKFIGEDALDIFNTFNLSKTDQKNETSILNAFEEYCVPKKMWFTKDTISTREIKNRVSRSSNFLRILKD